MTELLLGHSMYHMAPFSLRENFGTFLNSVGLVGTAVEIGVHQGYFAVQLLGRWNGRRYYGVDPWLDSIEGYDQKQIDTLMDYWKGGGKRSGPARTKDKVIAQNMLQPFSHRVTLLQKTSAEAASVVPDGIDFVYIDGNHRRPYVLQDIQLWWPKIISGGILAGHDIHCNSDWAHEIEPAVREFFEPLDIPVYLVSETARHPWSWYACKP